MLFHVRVTLQSKKGVGAYQFGLTQKQLQQRIVQRYRKGQGFLVEGRIIDPSDLEQIQIARSSQSVEVLMAEGRARDREGSRYVVGGDLTLYHAFECRENVTGQFIDGPPGEMRKRRRKKASGPTSLPESASRGANKDEFTIDENRRSVSFDGETFVFPSRSKLTFALLFRLNKANGRPVKFWALNEKGDVWDGDDAADSTIRGAVHRLKSQLKSAKMHRLAEAISTRSDAGEQSVILELTPTTANSN